MSTESNETELNWALPKSKRGIAVGLENSLSMSRTSDLLSKLVPMSLELIEELESTLGEEVSIVDIVADDDQGKEALNIFMSFKTYNLTILVDDKTVNLIDLDIDPNNINHTVKNTGRDREKNPTKTEPRFIETKVINALQRAVTRSLYERMLVSNVKTDKVRSILKRLSFEEVLGNMYEYRK